jgi:hypothetical protein
LGGSFTDNASAGGIFVAVDDDGTLHKSAFTEYRKEYTVHPDTDIVFEGQKIEHLDKVIALAKRLQLAIPQVGVVNWDFTIDESGEPVLIEANMKNDVQAGSIWLPQMAHGKGAFGENTASISWRGESDEVTFNGYYAGDTDFNTVVSVTDIICSLEAVTSEKDIGIGIVAADVDKNSVLNVTDIVITREMILEKD